MEEINTFPAPETTVEVVDLNTLGNELAGGEANYNFYD